MRDYDHIVRTDLYYGQDECQSFTAAGRSRAADISGGQTTSASKLARGNCPQYGWYNLPLHCKRVENIRLAELVGQK